MSEFGNLLGESFRQISELGDPQLEALENHYSLLLRWNARMSLTTVRDLKEAVYHHYCESLFVGTHLPAGSTSVVDVGSGAGFPGFPIGVLRSDCVVTLIESNSRKCVFLREASRDLANILVHEARAESVASHYDCVVARAVTWKELMPSLGRLGSHLMLLIAGADAQTMKHQLPIEWRPPIHVPWGHDRVLLVGDVPRGTLSEQQVPRGTRRGTISESFTPDGQGNRRCQPKGRCRKDHDRH